jgi:HEAT repeat protein
MRQTETRPAVGWVGFLAILAAPLFSEDVLRNARITERAGTIEDAVRGALKDATGPTWIAWSVPQSGGQSFCCCDGPERRESACTLEEDHDFGSSRDDRASGPPTVMQVFLRISAGRMERLRVLSEGCVIDAGGRSVVRLRDVGPKESLEFLAALARGRDDASARLTDPALMAIAHHTDNSADAVLEAFTAPDRGEEVRKKAAFWMGAARGRRGYDALARLAREDRNDRFREHVVFALSVSHEPAALDAMLEVARRDASPGVRGQALFWLAQKAGRKAMDGITRAIEDDPETGVKRKAVFALSQLPKDEGVPLLLRTARTNRNPVVRREAMFWLGQSKDPRALDFFQEVLGR